MSLHQQYPGFVLHNLPGDMMEEELLAVVYNTFGRTPANYRDGKPKVEIFKPSEPQPGPSHQQLTPMFANAVVSGVLFPYKEIRRRITGVRIRNDMFAVVADVDFGIKRQKDSFLSPNEKILHLQCKKSFGDVPKINIFNKNWLEDQLGGFSVAENFVVFDDVVGNVRRDMIKEAGFMIRYARVTKARAQALRLKPTGLEKCRTGWNNLMIEYETPLDAMQSICHLNRNSKFSPEKKCFITSKGKKCSVKNEFMGRGKPIDIQACLTKYGYIPFWLFRPEILNRKKMQELKANCMACDKQLELLGIHPSFSFIAATCVCITKLKKRALEEGKPIALTHYTDFNKRGSGLYFAWPGEDFVRLSVNKYYEQKENRFENVEGTGSDAPLIYCLKGVKPQYENVAEFTRTAYVVSSFEHSYNNRQYFEHHQASGTVTLANQIERRSFRGKERMFTQVKVNLGQFTQLWLPENSFKIGGVTVVVNPNVIYKGKADKGMPPTKPMCSYKSSKGERRIAGKLLGVRGVSQAEVEVELGVYFPLDMEVGLSSNLFLIPKTPDSERISLRKSLANWRSYRRRMDRPTELIEGKIIKRMLLKDLDWELPERPIGSLRAILLHIEVGALPVWIDFRTRLTEEYVGADLEILASTNGGTQTNPDPTPSAPQHYELFENLYPMLGKAVTDSESLVNVNARIIDIWPVGEETFVLTAALILDGNLTPQRTQCALRLWSLRPVNRRNIADSAASLPAPIAFVAAGEENDEHDIHDLELEDEENIPDPVFIPANQRDIRFQQTANKWYIETLDKFTGRINLNTNCMSTVLDSIREKPMQYPDLGMLDFLLHKMANVNHDPFVKHFQFRNNPEFVEIANRINSTMLNSFQKEAVEKATKYRLFFCLGPPGSGKTYTMTMFMLSLYLLETGLILVTCPSNYATQNAFEAMQKHKKAFGLGGLNAFRMLSRSRERCDLNYGLQNQDINQVHVRVHTDLRWGENGMDAIVQKVNQHGIGSLTLEQEAMWNELESELQDATLDQAHIIYATVGTGSDNRLHSLVNRMKKRGSYVSALVVDESGLLSQPSLITVMTLQAQRVAFFGDDKQLSATASSQTTENANLGVSFFTLMRSTDYFKNENPYTELLYQYRMAYQICQLSSDLMYDGELLTHPIVLKRDYITGYEAFYAEFPELKRKHVGLYSYRKSGKEEKHGVSRINMTECIMIKKLVFKLNKGGVTDIGVIAMYDAQVQLLKRTIGTIPGLQISTVDGFQGKEASAIILSMVRSNKENGIGFTKHPNRLNVSMSRAKDFLLIVYDYRTYENCKISQITEFFGGLRKDYGVQESVFY